MFEKDWLRLLPNTLRMELRGPLHSLCEAVYSYRGRDKMTQHSGDLGQQDLTVQWAEYVAARLDAGHSRTAIQMALVEAGLTPVDASAFVEAVTKEHKARKRRAGIWSIVIGVVLIAVGLGITAWSYSDAGPGGRYWIFWGLPLVGGWRVIAGLVKLLGGRP